MNPVIIVISISSHPFSFLIDQLQLAPEPESCSPSPIIIAKNNNLSKIHLIKLIPNPAITDIIVEVPSDFNKKFKIFNCTGKIVMEFEIKDGNSVNLNLKNLQSGLYFINGNDGLGNKIVEKLLKL